MSHNGPVEPPDMSRPRSVRGIVPRAVLYIGAAATLLWAVYQLARPIQLLLGGEPLPAQVDDKTSTGDEKGQVSVDPFPAMVATGAAVIVLLIVTGIDVTAFLLHKRHKTSLITIATSPNVSPPGYFRLLPYEDTEADREQFVQRSRPDGAHKRVLDLVERAGPEIAFLTGASGSGKSSILHAYVIPTLRKQGHVVVSVRAFDDVIGRATAALRAHLHALELHSTEPQSIEATARTLAAAVRGRLIIVLDQFEEILISSGQHAKRLNPVNEVLDLVRVARVDKLTILLSLRREYLPQLIRLSLPSIALGGNWEEVSPFDLGAAEKFFTDSPLKLQANAIQIVLDEAQSIDATPGLIRPITLNMLGLVLNRYAPQSTKVPGRVVAKGVLRRFLKESISTVDIRDYAPKVLRVLVTSSGTRQPGTVRQIARSAGVDESVVKGCLLSLQVAGITRPIDRMHDLWEVSHDFVARLLAPILAGWRATLWTRLRPTLLPIATALLLLVVGLYVPASGKLTSYQAQGAITSLGGEIGQEARGTTITFNRANIATLPSAVIRLNRVIAITGLRIINCTSLTTLAGIEELNSLQTLVVGASPVTDLGELGSLRQLRTLQLSNVPSVVDLETLAGSEHLEALFVDDVADIKGFDALHELSALKRLAIGGLPTRTELEIPAIPTLQSVTIQDMPDLTAITGTEYVQSVETLGLRDLPKVRDLRWIADLPKLYDLRAWNCPGINEELLLKLKHLVVLSVDEGVLSEAGRRELRRRHPGINITESPVTNRPTR